MKRYFIKMAFSGKNYHGWQSQENAHTVQAEINNKLSLLLRDQINVVGCGRTDTGVHAKEFYAHFDCNQIHLTPVDLVYKLNRFLPPDIVVYQIFEVENKWHARFSALNRTYRYYISKTKNPFLRDFNVHFNSQLNVAAMQQAADLLKNYSDFTSFSKLHSKTDNNICLITEANWEENADQLVFTISANRFLRNMVRAIVGTLIEIGKGKMKPEDIQSIIESKNRSFAGSSVPADGLFLEKVLYPF